MVLEIKKWNFFFSILRSVFDNGIQRHFHVPHSWSKNLHECCHVLCNNYFWFLVGHWPRKWKWFSIRQWNSLWSFGISICIPICHIYQENFASSRRQRLATYFLQQCKCYAFIHSPDGGFWRVSRNFVIPWTLQPNLLDFDDSGRRFWMWHWLCHWIAS